MLRKGFRVAAPIQERTLPLGKNYLKYQNTRASPRQLNRVAQVQKIERKLNSLKGFLRPPPEFPAKAGRGTVLFFLHCSGSYQKVMPGARRKKT